MKKRNGFTIIELLMVLIVLGVILTIAVPTVSRQIEKSRDNTYKSHEKALEDAAKRFITKCIAKNKCDDNSSAESYTGEVGNILKYTTLVDKGYIDELKDPRSNVGKCTGYVNVTNNLYQSILICYLTGESAEYKFNYYTKIDDIADENTAKYYIDKTKSDQPETVYITKNEIKENYNQSSSYIETNKRLTLSSNVKDKVSINLNKSSIVTKNISLNIKVNNNNNNKSFNYYLSDNKNNISDETKYTSFYNDYFTIGKGLTGPFYLFIERDSFKYINNISSNDKYIIYGPYKFDNELPKCNISINTKDKTQRVVLSILTDDNDLATNPYNWDNTGYSNKNEYFVFNNGEHTLTILDKVGNYSKCSINVDNIDSSIPKISYNHPAINESINDITISSSISSNTDLSKLDYYKRICNKSMTKCDNSEIDTYDITSKMYNNRITISIPGYVQVCQNATNINGLSSGNICSPFVLIDKDKPYTPYIGKITGNTNSSSNCNVINGESDIECNIKYEKKDFDINLNYPLKSIDLNSSIQNYQFSKDANNLNSNWSSITQQEFNDKLNYLANKLLPGGTSFVYIRSIDKAGNTSYKLIIKLSRVE